MRDVYVLGANGDAHPERNGTWVAREKFEGVMPSILLVEDSKFLRMASERTLARAGYVVISTDDGEYALQMARAKAIRI